MDVIDIFNRGGPAMWPLLALSILSLSVIVERLWFWFRIFSQEREIVNRILDAASDNWASAMQLARRATDQPIGRFLYAPLRISKPDPEVFRLALEASAEDELAAMRQGEKILEAVIALAPLLGLLGTVLGLIRSLGDIRLGDLGTASAAGVTLGIGEALIATATGLIVASFSLVFYRLFQGFVVNQVKVFRRAGSDLELLYRQYWPNVPDSITSPRAADVRAEPGESFIEPQTTGKLNTSENPEQTEVIFDSASSKGYSPPRLDKREGADASEK